MIYKNKLAEFITTFCYIGKIKYCPGTFGSLMAFPLWYLILNLTLKYQIIFSFANLSRFQAQIISILIVTFLICLLLFIIGTYFSSVYSKYVMKDDPKEIVIDEVVGQMLTILLSSFSIIFINYSKIIQYLDILTINIIFLLVLPFILFRFFDITKPWPINWVDRNIKGGIGIMIDDVMAAVFASVIHYVITFTLINWFG
ncbi:MAG: phosphatidylglycerophosphatase A [Rickettsia endosymbiont of Bryobia graminum]|nr:phosphatidylglycerophosphatase A [Rickettsia endosymbiont of Bryobia graminum]